MPSATTPSSCLIRPAVPGDAAAIVEVTRASITKLCVADHRHDPATLERWLANKTIAHVQRWLAAADNHLLVVEFETEICGVGLVRRTGDLNLLYLQPGRQRRGLGRALLRELEKQATVWELAEIRLLSTLCARPFYERHGYAFLREEPGFGVLRNYCYAKVLARPENPRSEPNS